ncbi:hypothetical protein LR48_Vigan08g005800 [Vigna angularis]|nr:hypothetical protein LR48_Vigan08g005800 [Vigna angularis]
MKQMCEWEEEGCPRHEEEDKRCKASPISLANLGVEGSQEPMGETKTNNIFSKQDDVLSAVERLTDKLEDGGTKVILKEQYSGLTTFSPRLNDGDPKSECENNSPRVPLQLEHHGGVDGEHDYPTTAPRLKHHD